VITSLHIREVQSLAKADLPLGRFTVVVGSSNTGKSAIVRALRLLARNGASTGLVREGAKGLTVAAKFADGSAIKLSRGKESTYTVIRPEHEPDLFTKCGVNVPPDVEQRWRLAQVDVLGDLNFAQQHDAPFMLSQPASQVARALGTLTNAHLLNDAVREANRRRLEANADEKARRREEQESREALLALGDLPARKVAIERAGAAVAEAEGATGWVKMLEALITGAAAVRSDLARLAVVAGPSDDAVQACELAATAVTWAAALERALFNRTNLLLQISQSVGEAVAEHAQVDALEAQIRAKLVEAGSCPTCGQTVR